MDSRTDKKIVPWIHRPPGSGTHILTCLAAVLTLLAGIAPGGYITLWLTGGVLWLIVGFVWILRAMRWIATFFLNLSRSTMPGEWRFWLATPLLFFAVIVLYRYDVPFKAAFSLSRPAMERIAHEAMTTRPPACSEPHLVGLYWTNGCDREAYGMSFDLTSGWFESYGFAYSQLGTPPTEHGSNLSTKTYTPITGNWYQWEFTQDW